MIFVFADGTANSLSGDRAAAFRSKDQETTSTGIAVPDKETVSQAGLNRRAQQAKGSILQTVRFAKAQRLYLAAIKSKDQIQPERE